MFVNRVMGVGNPYTISGAENYALWAKSSHQLFLHCLWSENGLYILNGRKKIKRFHNLKLYETQVLVSTNRVLWEHNDTHLGGWQLRATVAEQRSWGEEQPCSPWTRSQRIPHLPHASVLPGLSCSPAQKVLNTLWLHIFHWINLYIMPRVEIATQALIWLGGPSWVLINSPPEPFFDDL